MATAKRKRPQRAPTLLTTASSAENVEGEKLKRFLISFERVSMFAWLAAAPRPLPLFLEGLQRADLWEATDDPREVDAFRYELILSASVGKPIGMSEGHQESRRVVICQPPGFERPFSAARFRSGDGTWTCIGLRGQHRAAEYVSNLIIVVKDDTVVADEARHQQALEALQLIGRCRNAIENGDPVVAAAAVHA